MSNSAPFPLRGQIWEVVDGCEAEVQYLFSAPIFLTGIAKLAAGERVRVMNEAADSPPPAVNFLPVRYDELHASLVPADIRETPRYKKYLLTMKPADFQRHFRFIENEAIRQPPSSAFPANPTATDSVKPSSSA